MSLPIQFLSILSPSPSPSTSPFPSPCTSHPHPSLSGLHVSAPSVSPRRSSTTHSFNTSGSKHIVLAENRGLGHDCGRGLLAGTAPRLLPQLGCRHSSCPVSMQLLPGHPCATEARSSRSAGTGRWARGPCVGAGARFAQGATPRLSHPPAGPHPWQEVVALPAVTPAVVAAGDTSGNPCPPLPSVASPGCAVGRAVTHGDSWGVMAEPRAPAQPRGADSRTAAFGEG